MSEAQQASPLAILCDWALSMHAFRRNRVPPAKKVVAAALCAGGYSYREVSRLVGGISYVGARDAYLAMVTSLPEEAKRRRKEVAIDGSDVRVGERSLHVWLARDVESGDIMAFQASEGGTSADGARFLASVAAQCANKPLLRLGTGPNSPRGLANADLYFQARQPGSIIGRLGRLIIGSALSPGRAEQGP